jgi:hypothetical protein
MTEEEIITKFRLKSFQAKGYVLENMRRLKDNFNYRKTEIRLQKLSCYRPGQSIKAPGG